MSLSIEKTYTSSAAMLHPGGPLPLLPLPTVVNPPPSPLLLVLVVDGFPPCPLDTTLVPPIPPVPGNSPEVEVALHPRAAAMNSEANVMVRTGTSCWTRSVHRMIPEGARQCALGSTTRPANRTAPVGTSRMKNKNG